MTQEQDEAGTLMGQLQIMEKSKDRSEREGM